MRKSTAQERPWSDHEKVSLLAEIIKLSSVPAEALLRLVRDFNVHPRWEDIPLPEGRSLNSSKSAFEEMNRQTGLYQLHTSGPYSQQAPQAQMPPTTVPRKRQLPGSEILAPSFPAIQPKPLGLSPAPYTPIPPENAGSFRPSPGDSAGEPAKKRRGRPSNAQIEQEKAVAAAEGREWQPRPPRPPRKKKSLPSKDSPPRDDAGPSQHLVPQTPGIQMGEAEEEGSSGKRRRRKAREETTVVRAAPYDPVRQSPAEAVPFTGEGHPSATPHPPEAQIQPAADLNLSPIDQHLMTKTHILSDKSQHMQTECLQQTLQSQQMAATHTYDSKSEP